MSSKIKGERGGSTTVVLCEEGSEVYEFWEALPGGKGAVMAADDPSLQDDSAAEASAKEVREGGVGNSWPSCRLFLGPGFRLGARWNRLGQAVKTRKKREKTGGKWARYGLRSVTMCGICWIC